MRSIVTSILPIIMLLTSLLFPALTLAYTGDMTYYTPGVGSCGYVSNSGQDVVALSSEVMANGGNPNTNHRCGTHINIWNPSTRTSHDATIVDTCPTCGKYDIDVSESLFYKVAPNGNGRAHGINWGGPAVGG